MPLFHRSSWFADFPDANCIALNDPSLYLNDQLLCGWFQGTSSYFYLEYCVEILKKIAYILNVNPENIYFYGSSAGGFSSLMMASHFHNSTAIAEIAQTDLRNYNIKSAINNLLTHCYGGKSFEEVVDLYSYRLSVLEYYKKIQNIPNILCIQNCADSHHLQQHFLPFAEGMEVLLAGKNVFFRSEFYSARSSTGGGHTVAPREWVVKLIKSLF
jgi:hypothetical protein